MKIPTPPLPNALKRTPPKPGSRNGQANGNGAGPSGLPPKQSSVDRQRLKEQAKEVPIAALGWLDERAGASPFLRGFLYRKVPKGVNWFYTLGSATMFAFVAQAVTGVFLAMYYNPSPAQAWESVSYITNEVNFLGLGIGELVRGMHRWGSSVMIILIFLHMGRTFFFGAYKYPRELNWIIGVVLLVLTLAMGLTGYLLPFDQRGFWATVVAVNINASGPIMGPYLADFLRGGAEFGAATLSRFYAIHMLLIPGLIAALIGAHLYLVAKLGITAPPWLKAEKARALSKEEI
ncbi:MAG TPA: cytochrome b N-terminal domain-containing protein [Candidatus Caenarcaniphilales bacterium]|nr:cytochrome b N-terminal domain-containing protein [Candidatus Caenarcaniphilales bacterium]